jgi:hypothetical protein
VEAALARAFAGLGLSARGRHWVREDVFIEVSVPEATITFAIGPYTLRIDVTERRRMWRGRQAAAETVRRRIDPTGMTRPARSPEERAWLEERGMQSVFVEVERSESS